MSEPFLAEIRMFGFNFAPRGFLLCDGSLLPINQNQSLFSLVGTTFGGDGRTTFGIPDLRARVPVHSGNGSAGAGLTPRPWGAKGGAESHTLTDAELPAHNHGLQASGAGATTDIPVGKAYSNWRRRTPPFYTAPDNLVAMHGSTVARSGGANQAHTNIQPSLAINFVIAAQGIFPSRN